MKLSIVISAFNEEKKIRDCLESMKDLSAQIIFVDNQSSDKTVEIARRYTSKIYIRKNDPVMLNRNKNFGSSKANGDWILSIDADERLSRQLCSEIKVAIKSTNYNGYEIPRKNIIFGKWIRNSIWWPDYNPRLFRRGFGKFPLKNVHEKLEIEGEIGRLENPIIHFNYETISQFISKMNKTYTESEVKSFILSGKTIYWFDAIRWPLSDFLKTFFLQKGYRDGLHGLVLSLLQAFYALVVFAKVWERKEHFREMTPPNFLAEVFKEFGRATGEIRHWVFESLAQENPARSLYYKIRKKLR